MLCICTKCETLRFLRMLIGNNLHGLDRADAVEELEQVTLRRVKRQITHVDARR